MNPKLLDMLQKLKETGSAPKRTAQQLVEMGIPGTEVDSTPSFALDRKPAIEPTAQPEDPTKLKESIRMLQLNKAIEQGDSDEVLRLRKMYRDEISKLNGLFDK
jgi:hypothetical protein